MNDGHSKFSVALNNIPAVLLSFASQTLPYWGTLEEMWAWEPGDIGSQIAIVSDNSGY